MSASTTAEMDDLVDRATAKLECLEEALAGLSSIRARYTSDDGCVTAEVDGNGTLTGLWLEESITAKPANEVGPSITSAAHEAARIAGERRAQVIDRLNNAFGVDGPQ